MAGDRIWGDLPREFKKLAAGERRVAVRADAAADSNIKDLLNGRSDGDEESRFHGRAKLSVLRMESGAGALVRRYRHGGALRYLTGDVFVTWPPRPFKELAVTEEARRRGVPTVEILAAGIDRVWGPLYRGWLMTRELEGARDLWAVLQEGSGAKAALLRQVARAIQSMHRQGIYHGDLNLKNILIRREDGELKAYIIDFDKAGFFPGGVPAVKARRNLARLRRSIAKLDPERRYCSGADWEALVGFYREAETR
jgi:3-deoxy-D-manno-octulosonic acid kinase